VSGLLPRLADALTRVSARWVPDAFSIAALLTLLALGLGLTVGGASPAQCALAWGNGVWALLSFGMQIALVIFAGYVLAVAPPVARALEALARVPRGPRSAVAWTAFLSMALCWLNWGMGLIASAMLVRTIGRARPDTDYRLLVAVAYLGMGTTWHGGPSGSVPLLFATPGSFMIRDGLLAGPVPLSQTIFTVANLGLMLVVVLVLTAFAALLHPPRGRTLAVSPERLAGLATFETPARPNAPTPAERLVHGPWLNRALGLLALAYVLLQARAGTFAATLDSVNLVALALGLLLHPSPASLGKAAEEASRPLHGVVLQFPLYAGIYGIIKDTGLVESLTHAFLAVSTPGSYPLVVFAYSAVLNYLVPSGGAKWAMEAPYVLGAARELGVPATSVAMAYAYGDMATNLVQPFWAIPLLGVARLEFRDILGYELLALAVYSVIVSLALVLVFSL
jgi:short-chain fatty acids transporter